MQLVEPQRGLNLLQSMNARASSSKILFTVISVLADAIVFLFPVFLVVIYIVGMKKKNDTFKEYALRIFSSAVVAALVNIIIQFFFNKARPESALEGTGGLLLKHLPTMSFPSDHAAVGLVFGIAMYYFVSRWMRSHQKSFMISLSIFFIVGAIVMSISRVAVGIHWPTDILAGWIVALLAVCITKNIPEGIFLRLIRIEKKIFSFLYK